MQQRIEGKAKTVKDLLKGTRYSIDYYQRDYKWEQKQIFELIDDLVDAFLESYQPHHERVDVRAYGRYFLGSIIVSTRDNKQFIVDGQQRLTSLTLLLIYLKNQQRERQHPVPIDDLILGEEYGVKGFNLDVDDRVSCLQALYDNQPFDETDSSESVQNLMARYGDIVAHFPIARPESNGDRASKGPDADDKTEEALDRHALPYFIDWLIGNVDLIEIVAASDDDAYTIFETMNDRGLSLSPTDMLKGYLLANVTDEKQRKAASELWKKRIGQLDDFGKDTPSDFFKAWFRSQYAERIRERKKGARPEEFDKIGTEFHRWFREKSDELGVGSGGEFFGFMEKNLDFYARQYLNLLRAANGQRPGLERIHYLHVLGFTQQFMVLLAPLRPGDNEDEIHAKLRIVSAYIDILLTWRQWNYRTISYSSMQYAMFLAVQKIRPRTSATALAEELHTLLATEGETFEQVDTLRLHQRNGWFIRNLLARVTDYVEVESGNPSKFDQLMEHTSKNRYEIEHIWSVDYDEHADEFPHPSDFTEYRNRIGGLLLVPKSFNASYGKEPYEKKLPHYFGQNLLAQSLSPLAYAHNPGFMRFIDESHLPFKPHEQFKKADMDDRQELYRQIAEQIWYPDLLLREVDE